MKAKRIVKFVILMAGVASSSGVIATTLPEERCHMDALTSMSSDTTLAEVKKHCEEKTTKHSPNTDATDSTQEASLLDTRREQQNKAETNRSIIIPHRRNYAAPLSFMKDPNQAPFESVGGEVLPEDALDNLEIKFQVSMKKSFASDVFLKGGKFYFGFTMLSMWQAYNDVISAPFRETSYEPEVYWSMPFKMKRIDSGIVNVGFVHQSNGQAGTLSRSWNRIYVNFLWEKDGHVYSFKPCAYSGLIWPLILELSGHPYCFYLASDSGIKWPLVASAPE